MTREELAIKHGTLAEFERAVWNALGEISIDEAQIAVEEYRREWNAAVMMPLFNGPSRG